MGSKAHLGALEGIILDAKKARVMGPKASSEEGPAEILRALGKQLLEAASSLESGEGAVAVEVSTEDSEPSDFEEYENEAEESEEDDEEEKKEMIRQLLSLR